MEPEVKSREGIEHEGNDLDLISKMSEMTIKKEAGDGDSDEETPEKSVLNMANPVFKVSVIF